MASHANLYQREIKGNKEDKCWIWSRKRMLEQEKERENGGRRGSLPSPWHRIKQIEIFILKTEIIL